MRGPLHYAHLILFLLLSLWELCWCFASAYNICPTSLPCHCISEVVYCAFQELHRLPDFGHFEHAWKDLNLSENFLSSLPESGFEKVKVLNLLLQRNKISYIHPKAFRGIRNLTMLDLSHNHIKDLPARVFEPIRELQSLALRYNQMEVVDNQTFVGATHLTELDLEGNDLTRVPVTALSLLTRLRRLILRNNRLLFVEAFAFNNLPLEYLDLGSNSYDLDIQDGAFCGLDPKIKATEPGAKEWTGLNAVRLDHNGLSTVSLCLTKMLWTLTLVDLSGNPLYCNCQLLTLRDLGPKTEFPQAQCAKPKRYAGQYLSEIDSVKLRCSNETAASNVGDNYCRNMCKSSRPPPSMTQVSGAASQLHPGTSYTLRTLLWIWMASLSLLQSVTLITKNLIGSKR